MSWQPYVDRLVGDGDARQAAIFGLDGTELATSPSFKVSATEAQNIIAGIGGTAVHSGYKIAGVKYFILKHDDRSVFCKKGSSGAYMVKTKQHLLIGVYTEGIAPTKCEKAVQTLADYLSGIGY
ncbi:hypothetical protein INT45_007553 [Circinella minor]|uniref:Profilin n=1 Tax=Circinella minor TaxID=1195481 RepID=A0A8H7S5H8_9FUNG|nr:hypothetical protein INT45_007553 [Circinella minor]